MTDAPQNEDVCAICGKDAAMREGPFDYGGGLLGHTFKMAKDLLWLCREHSEQYHDGLTEYLWAKYLATPGPKVARRG